MAARLSPESSFRKGEEFSLDRNNSNEIAGMASPPMIIQSGEGESVGEWIDSYFLSIEGGRCTQGAAQQR